MKRPNCVVCNQPASHVALFDDGNNNFKGSAVCAQHKENPSMAVREESLIARIEGFSVPDDAVCDLQSEGIPAGGAK
jgi:hypothetical protein